MFHSYPDIVFKRILWRWVFHYEPQKNCSFCIEVEAGEENQSHPRGSWKCENTRVSLTFAKAFMSLHWKVWQTLDEHTRWIQTFALLKVCMHLGQEAAWGWVTYFLCGIGALLFFWKALIQLNDFWGKHCVHNRQPCLKYRSYQVKTKGAEYEHSREYGNLLQGASGFVTKSEKNPLNSNDI